MDEPAVDADFQIPTQAPPPATGPTCRASQVDAALDHWIHKSTHGEVNDPVMDGSLYGYVVLTNTSRTACQLHGIPTVQLATDGKAVRLDHIGVRTRPPVGLPPGGKANFRLDWDAPYCPTSQGHNTLAAKLPGVGGFPVRLADQTVPGCVHDETHPQIRTALSPGPVANGDAQPRPPATSPLTALTARAGDLPAHVHPGQTFDFTVTLSNPTGKALSLAGRPGFSLDVLCQSTPASGREGLGGATKVYLLNNRPVRRVPAHGSVRFAIRVSVPQAPSFPGPRLTVTWRLLTLGYPSGLPYVVVNLPTGVPA
ncbi:DUF4232 domain-containing protein [Streptomyces sp. NPDC021020]|uniref:DUF4232 domain-containing protein n=1 Tax=Streptomyces sp. NPDC021020 TaxID=3365109 RepID=UPI0037A1C4D0